MNSSLPIGTVVMIKGINQKYVIIGSPAKDENDTVYDYVCVVYPYGYVETMNFVYINKTDITKVVMLGNMN